MQSGREQVHSYLELLRFNLAADNRRARLNEEFFRWSALVVGVCLILAALLLFAAAAFGEPSDSALADAIYWITGDI